ncbi:MAG: septum formation initiator family protein [bacterium]|nr:septum formation initiator family protein [bacterium]
MSKPAFSKTVGLGILLAALFLAFTVFSDRGLLRVRKLSAERDAIAEAARLMEKQNKNLATEKNALKDDMDTIERAARENLDMTRSDEIIYKFVE